LIVALFVMLLPDVSSALAMVDFASSNGQFSISNLVIDFGADLQVTSANDNGGIADPSVIGFSVDLDPIVLTGNFTPFGPFFFFEVDTTRTYQLRIRDLAGQLVLQANYNPGQFFAVSSNGNVSPTVGPDVSNLLNFFPGAYPSLDSLSGALTIDFNATLSAAGQDVGALITAGTPVFGSAAGTLVATAVPEPGTLALIGAGLAGLTWRRRRRRG